GFPFLVFLVLLVMVVVFSAAFYLAFIVSDYDVRWLPTILDPKNHKPPNPHETVNETNRIFDAEGNLIHEFHGDEDRIYVPLEQISEWARKAIIASEDVRFYYHKGFDMRATLRAFFKNVQTREASEGGSTITQQLARNMYLGTGKTLSNERTFTRKLKELLLARKIEQAYSKNEILEFYLNQVYFGSRAYGIESAAKRYFGISAKNLTLAQSSMLAGVLSSPSFNNPYDNLAEAKKAQDIVLEKMAKNGFITDIQMEKASKEKLNFQPYSIQLKAGDSLGYFIDYVKDELYDKLGEFPIKKGGLDIYTTINQDCQKYALQAVDKVLGEAIRAGDFGKIQKDKLGVEQPQVALCAIDADTGQIQAMVGGRDYKNTQYNRCTALRQPGSSFKILVYSAALQHGVLSPSSLVRSSPISIGDWQPKEWFRGYFGTVTVKYALQESSNICAIRAALKVGLGNVVATAKKMGISTSKLLAVPSIAIGYVEVKPIEMASVGQTISNYGTHIPPIAIKRIENRKTGKTIDPAYGQPTRAIDEPTAYDMISM
ncbi:MAG: hypothetical protein GYA78_00910, partial [Caldisericales bacterium]|nr:hypothetical protein [Caldisericales bacterium]